MDAAKKAVDQKHLVIKTIWPTASGMGLVNKSAIGQPALLSTPIVNWGLMIITGDPHH